MTGEMGAMWTWPNPRIGMPAHYVARGSADGKFPPCCRAAVVTEVGPEETRGDSLELRRGPVVGLLVMNPTGFFFHALSDGGCVYDDPESGAGGTWHTSSGCRA